MIPDAILLALPDMPTLARGVFGAGVAAWAGWLMIWSIRQRLRRRS